MSNLLQRLEQIESDQLQFSKATFHVVDKTLVIDFRSDLPILTVDNKIREILTEYDLYILNYDNYRSHGAIFYHYTLKDVNDFSGYAKSISDAVGEEMLKSIDKYECSDCKDTKQYVPLFGPPESCQTCCKGESIG